MSSDPAASSEAIRSALHILEVPANRTVKVIFLEQYHGLLLHYGKGRSIVCTMFEGECYHCRSSPALYYAFAAGRVYNPVVSRWQAKVIQVTARAEEVLRDRSIRGEVWELHREPKRQRRAGGPARPGELMARYLTSLPPEKVGNSFLIEPCIRNAMSYHGVLKWVQNETAPRSYVDDIEIDDDELRQYAHPVPPPKPPTPARKTMAELEAERRAKAAENGDN